MKLQTNAGFLKNGFLAQMFSAATNLCRRACFVTLLSALILPPPMMSIASAQNNPSSQPASLAPEISPNPSNPFATRDIAGQLRSKALNYATQQAN